MSRIVSTVRTGGSPLMRKGVYLILVLAIVLAGLTLKNQITVALRRGATISAEFPSSSGLVKDQSKVKLAGLQIGVVTGIDHGANGAAVVKMKIDKSALKDLGSAPSARIEPLTILGGEYSVELTNGGTGSYDGSMIPEKRTGTPVELDRILEALPTRTRQATRGLVKGLGDTFDRNGQRSLRQLTDVAPPVLRGAGTFLTAFQGTDPNSDLQGIVVYLQRAAGVLAKQRSDVDGALTGLDTTSAALARSSSAIGQTIERLPAALDHANDGLGQLHVTLNRLGTTAKELQPTAARATGLADALDPLLIKARPVVAKLAPITRDAIPTVRELIPTVTSADGFVGDLGGSTIDKVRGPVLSELSKPWNGKAAGDPEYAHSGLGIQADNKFYQEVAYMIVNLGRSVITQDGQGSMLNFQAGVGLGSAAPLSLDDALAQLIPQIEGPEK